MGLSSSLMLIWIQILRLVTGTLHRALFPDGLWFFLVRLQQDPLLSLFSCLLLFLIWPLTFNPRHSFFSHLTSATVRVWILTWIPDKLFIHLAHYFFITWTYLNRIHLRWKSLQASIFPHLHAPQHPTQLLHEVNPMQSCVPRSFASAPNKFHLWKDQFGKQNSSFLNLIWRFSASCLTQKNFIFRDKHSVSPADITHSPPDLISLGQEGGHQQASLSVKLMLECGCGPFWNFPCLFSAPDILLHPTP